ncbi:MAG: hypothetical protein NZ957_06380, partial [Thaumarchaeota archaeon]|nr:hypothetical protein [Candidatus Calditenuaceae archaeon]
DLGSFNHNDHNEYYFNVNIMGHVMDDDNYHIDEYNEYTNRNNDDNTNYDGDQLHDNEYPYVDLN